LKEFNCERCKADTQEREKRGCGIRPILKDGTEWEPHTWRLEHPDVPLGGEIYEKGYMWSDLGAVAKLGWTWPWCPRWYSSEYTPEILTNEAIFADRLRASAEWDGGLSQLLGGANLSNRGFSLLKIARATFNVIQAVFEKDESERIKRESNNKPKKSRRNW
jgi:hypothetical protein